MASFAIPHITHAQKNLAHFKAPEGFSWQTFQAAYVLPLLDGPIATPNLIMLPWKNVFLMSFKMFGLDVT